MTLIVQAKFGGVPLLIGDVLLTSKARPWLDIRPPTVPWGSELVDRLTVGDEGPAGLSQKLLCGRHLAVGWSGKSDIATRVMGQFHAAVSNGKVTRKAVEDILATIPKDAELALLGWVEEADKVHGFKVGSTIEYRDSDGTELSVIGSGADFFKEVFNSHSKVTIGEPRPSAPLKESVEWSLLLAVQLLAIEVSTVETVRNFFGGAYEIATLAGRSIFAKLVDVSFFFWDAHVVDGQVMLPTHPSHVFRLAYLNEVLIVRAVRIHRDYGEWECSNELFRVRPSYRELGESELSSWKSPNVNAGLQGHIVLATNGGERHGFGFVSGLWYDDDRVEWSEKNGKLEINRQRRLHSTMGKFICDKWPELKVRLA